MGMSRRLLSLGRQLPGSGHDQSSSFFRYKSIEKVMFKIKSSNTSGSFTLRCRLLESVLVLQEDFPSILFQLLKARTA